MSRTKREGPNRRGHRPEFLAEAKKANLDLDLRTGEEVEKTIANLFKLEPSISNKLREILK
ncbi:MAG: hypothetical protein GEU77_19685 [Deltaproteobacteria bacterium]|nr:hypothetical protein [Deltaproteobacteria bacterium]